MREIYRKLFGITDQAKSHLSRIGVVVVWWGVGFLWTWLHIESMGLVRYDVKKVFLEENNLFSAGHEW